MNTTSRNQTVLSDIERDCRDARELLADAKRLDDGEKYRKAAKIILLKILHRHPEHEEARALLAEASGSPMPLASKPVAPKAPAPKTPTPPSRRDEDMAFTTGRAAERAQAAKKSDPAASRRGHKFVL